MATVRRRRGGREPQTWRTAGGDVLTSPDVEALAREAEAGHDLGKARVKRVGHSRLGAGVSPRVTFRPGAQLYAQVRARAAQERRSMSDLAREAVEQYIKHTDG